MQALEDELDGGRDLAGTGVVAVAEPVEDLRQAGNCPYLRQQLLAGDQLAGLDRGALGEQVGEAGQVEAGQPFRLYDSQGNLVLRDRGAIRFTVVFNTLGDATPGGIVIEELEPSVRGPHPGFDDATLCPVLVPLLTA